MEKETQTCCPKPIQGMSVHWRQQNSHYRNGNTRNKLNYSIRAEVIKKSALQINNPTEIISKLKKEKKRKEKKRSNTLYRAWALTSNKQC